MSSSVRHLLCDSLFRSRPLLVHARLVMFEPLAATVLTYILPSRPLANQLLAHKTAIGMVVRTAKHPLPSDFFTPHPWSAQMKGKGKALPEDDCSGVLDAESLMSHSPVIQGAAAVASMTNSHSPRPRTRRSAAHKHIASRTTCYIPSLRTWNRQVDVAQRRHSSSQTVAVSQTEQPSTPPAHDREAWMRTYEDVAKGAQFYSAENAWHAFRCLCESEGRPPGLPETAVYFVTHFTVAIVNGDHGSLSPKFLAMWGERIQHMLGQIEPGIEHSVQDPLRFRWNNLLMAAGAMVGRLDEATSSVHTSLGNMDQRTTKLMLQVCIILMNALRHHQGSAAVLAFLSRESTYLDRYLAGSEQPPPGSCIPNLRSTVLRLVTEPENSERFLRDTLQLLPDEHRPAAVRILVRALVQAERVKDALAVLDSLNRSKRMVPPETTLLVVESLVKARRYDDANTLFLTLPHPELKHNPYPHFRRFHHFGLLLGSKLTDPDKAQHHYDHIAQDGDPHQAENGFLLQAYANAGQPDRVVELFQDIFPETDSPTKSRKPNIRHYTAVLVAYAKVGNLDALNTWLNKLSSEGFHPDLHIYSVILQSFALRSDVKSMISLIDRMRKSGVAMNAVLYTTIIATLARRGDPIAAEQLFKRAIDENIEPDVIMVSAVMNAHVEAGSWEGVVRAFDFIRTHRTFAGISIEVFNTLMKAYVLIGAPFRVVANLFRQLGSVKLHPDARTFALLIQSACDSGFMDIASELFKEMQRLHTTEKRASLKVDIYVMTILLSGYLRQGKRIKAKEIMDDIKARGLQVSAITYAAIVKAYSQQSTDQGAKVAEEFLESLTRASDSESWLQMVGGRRLAMYALFQPVLRAYARRGRVDDVVRVHERMIESGTKPDIGTMTMLLDVYRRTRNIDGVQSIWPEVYRLALEHTQDNALLLSAENSPPSLDMYGPLLCVPLSIYIDALSAAGKHAEVAQTWKTLRDQGLRFDSHNWNHLVAALIRAGETQRAFDVVENVILRYQHQSRQQLGRERDTHPSSPLTLDLPPLDEGDLPRHRPEAPLHSGERRAVAAEHLTWKTRFNSTVEERGAEDFVHPLHLLFRMSPIWNIWRPHGATLVLLDSVLGHLRAGRLVQPLRPNGDEGEQWAINMDEVRERTAVAWKLLEDIRRQFPSTVQLVADYALMRNSSRRRPPRR